MNILLVVGNDKLGRKLISKIADIDDIHIVLDCSSNLKRILKILLKGILPFRYLSKMFLAEITREDYKIRAKEKIYNNDDLLRIIHATEIKRIYLFRAGLIVNRQILQTGVEIRNVHCATIPRYGGLGSIAKALEESKYDLQATLHRVTEKIDDDAEIYATKSYKLQKEISYRDNEDIAYDAGIELLLSELKILH